MSLLPVSLSALSFFAEWPLQHFAYLIVSCVNSSPDCPDCVIFCVATPETLLLCLLFSDVPDKKRHEVSSGQTPQSDGR